MKNKENLEQNVEDTDKRNFAPIERLSKIDVVKREGDKIHVLGRSGRAFFPKDHLYLHHIICDASTGKIIEENVCKEYSENRLDLYVAFSIIGIGVPLFFRELLKINKHDKYLKKVNELRPFIPIPTLEGVIVDKHYTPYQDAQGLFGTSSSQKCMLGIRLTDGSEQIFHYYGRRAEQIYLFNQKGDKVSFKEGSRPFDEIEETTK